jgi:uncharacterized protein (TIGR02246 family)
MTRSAAEAGVMALYEALLAAWNRRDAAGMAGLSAPQGSQVGFDGSTANGPQEIEAYLAPIFAHHPTAAFVGKVREIRLLSETAALLRAVAGMIPPGHDDINPDVNAIQTLVASCDGDGRWRVELFQNTPAAFHGRPEERERLTQELRALVRRRSTSP